MEKAPEVITYRFSDNESVCIISYKGYRYYVGPHKVVVDRGPIGPIEFVEFEYLPKQVKREYLLWRLSR